MSDNAGGSEQSKSWVTTFFSAIGLFLVLYIATLSFGNWLAS
jgi:hypothetical protein